MPFKAPLKILVQSDGNEMQFQNIRIINKQNMYVYKFTKSETKLNVETVFTEQELQKQLNSSFKIIS